MASTTASNKITLTSSDGANIEVGALQHLLAVQALCAGLDLLC